MQAKRSQFDPAQLPPKFQARIAVDDSDCWVWTGAKINTGYGEVRFNGRQWLVHRAVYEIAVGPIPTGMHILHRCDNPPCCNPAHLFPGTHSDNMRDKMTKGRGNYERRRSLRGTGNHLAKLTEDDVRDIRARYVPRVVPMAHLAREYGVTPSTICFIVKNKTWRHVKPS